MRSHARAQEAGRRGRAGQGVRAVWRTEKQGRETRTLDWAATKPARTSSMGRRASGSIAHVQMQAQAQALRGLGGEGEVGVRSTGEVGRERRFEVRGRRGPGCEGRGGRGGRAGGEFCSHAGSMGRREDTEGAARWSGEVVVADGVGDGEGAPSEIVLDFLAAGASATAAHPPRSVPRANHGGMADSRPCGMRLAQLPLPRAAPSSTNLPFSSMFSISSGPLVLSFRSASLAAIIGRSSSNDSSHGVDNGAFPAGAYTAGVSGGEGYRLEGPCPWRCTPVVWLGEQLQHIVRIRPDIIP